MNTHNKQHPAAGIAIRPVVAAVAIALASMAHAQQAAQPQPQLEPAKDNGKLDTVVVTANKRAQNLQDVPQAITVLNDAVIQRNNLRNMDDLPNLSPALTVSYGTQPGNFSLNLRGIGTFSLGIGVESDVAVVIDDVPFAMQANAFKDLADVNRIEILKGPQSTLLGKSAIAGAMNITTKPIDGIWKGKASSYLTSDGEWRLNGSVAGPLSDTVRMRVAASKSSFDGVVKNLADGSHLNGDRSDSIIGKLEWTPNDSWTLSVSPHASKGTKNCCVMPLNAMSAGGTSGGLYQNTAQLPFSSVMKGVNPGPGNVSVRNDYPAGGVYKDMGVSAKISYAFGPGSALDGYTLSSISSVSHYEMRDYQDGDGTDSDILAYYPLVGGKPTGFHGGQYQYGLFEVNSRSEELRLVSPDKGPLRWLAGLWYGDNQLGRELTRAPAPTTYTTDYGASTFNTSYAVFGQGSYDLTPQTAVVAGLRFNKEDTGYTFSRYTPPPAARSLSEHYQANDSENKVTGKLGLQHHLDANTMGYVTYSTGHKGKAYDLTSGFSATTAKFQPVPGEDAKSIEAGTKLTLLDNRMSLDLAVFRTRFTGFQQSAGVFDSDGVYRTTLHSIGGLQTSGLEADLSWRASRQLTLNGGFAYTRAIITNFENGPCYSVVNAAGTGTTVGAGCVAGNPKFNNANTADLAGKTLPNAPKVKFNLGGQYDLPMDGAYDAFFTGAYRWQSKTQFSLNQDPMTEQGGYGILNLGAGLKDKQNKLKVTFMVNNLLNKSYAWGLSNSPVGAMWSSKAPNPVVPVSFTTWMPARDYQRFFALRVDYAF